MFPGRFYCIFEFGEQLSQSLIILWIFVIELNPVRPPSRFCIEQVLKSTRHRTIGKFASSKHRGCAANSRSGGRADRYVGIPHQTLSQIRMHKPG
jgi:hypothetical protein